VGVLDRAVLLFFNTIYINNKSNDRNADMIRYGRNVTDRTANKPNKKNGNKAQIANKAIGIGIA
jgi:hypothetical protein